MDLIEFSFVSGLGCGICIGLSLYAINKLYFSANSNTESYSYSSDSDYKMALLVRTDLNMGKGKIAAQCGHAAVGAIEKAQKQDPEGLKLYKKKGQTKIALRIDSEEAIIEASKNAKKMGLVTSLIRDAGRTQIAANSITVLAIGPAPKDVIDKVTGHLKLL